MPLAYRTGTLYLLVRSMMLERQGNMHKQSRPEARDESISTHQSKKQNRHLVPARTYNPPLYSLTQANPKPPLKRLHSSLPIAFLVSSVRMAASLFSLARLIK